VLLHFEAELAPNPDDQNFKLDRFTKPNLQQTLVCYRRFRDLRIRA
jgi:hypothetical protein